MTTYRRRRHWRRGHWVNEHRVNRSRSTTQSVSGGGGCIWLVGLMIAMPFIFMYWTAKAAWHVWQAVARRGANTQGVVSVGGLAPSGWYADPTGRHVYRYWSGSMWTEYVSPGNGVRLTDPLK